LKPSSHPWQKVNANGSLLGNHASCGGILRDCRGTFLRCFAVTLSLMSVFEAELHCFIFDVERRAYHGWFKIRLEGHSTSALLAFKNHL